MVVRAVQGDSEKPVLVVLIVIGYIQQLGQMLFGDGAFAPLKDRPAQIRAEVFACEDAGFRVEDRTVRADNLRGAFDNGFLTLLH